MTLPSRTRTVIIGGGVIGCSIAYHLAREGRTDIVVLERSKLTSGTTWHAAGLVRRLRPSATLTRLINYSIELYGELEVETGQATGWTQTGSLTLATNPDRLTNIKRQVSLGRAFGLESEVVDAARAKELWPLIETGDVTGAVWSPADGRVNPSDVALALSKGARARGVQIFEDTAVTGLRKKGGRISGCRGWRSSDRSRRGGHRLRSLVPRGGGYGGRAYAALCLRAFLHPDQTAGRGTGAGQRARICRR